MSAGNVHPVMRPSLTALLTVIRSSLRTRVELEAEILALRHQLAVLQQTEQRRLRLSQTDRLLWVLLSGVWSRWREAVQIVQPATVVSVASPPLRLALALAFRATPARSPSNRHRRPRADPEDASRESLLGRAAHSR